MRFIGRHAPGADGLWKLGCAAGFLRRPAETLEDTEPHDMVDASTAERNILVVFFSRVGITTFADKDVQDWLDGLNLNA